jgi:uncharacterized membrane protein YtjA (UPF0391 family)
MFHGGTKRLHPRLSFGCGVAAALSKELVMLGWAVTFLLVALVAAFLGFGGIATFAVEIAKIVFFVAIVLFVISAVVTLIRGRSPTMP